MPPRYVRPSMGVIHNSTRRYVAPIGNHCSRNFHASARRLEDGADGKAASAPSTSPTPRKERNAQAVRNITSLQGRRPLPRGGGLAGGAFPSGRAFREPTNGAESSGAAPPPGAKVLTPRGPLKITREMVNSPPPRTGGAGRPPGTFARAPSQLNVTRNAPRTGKNIGPNLRGRAPGGPRGKGGSRGGGARKTKRREGKGKSKGPDLTQLATDVTVDHTLSDGMVQHLLRLQRKEWDRVPYEPKYAAGSLAANELIHAGRELFAGDAPPVKVWGRLEKTLGIVGMHGAEARLQVRRLPADKMTAPEEYQTMKKMGLHQRLPSLPLTAAERTKEHNRREEERAKTALKQVVQDTQGEQDVPVKAGQKVEA